MKRGQGGGRRGEEGEGEGRKGGEEGCYRYVKGNKNNTCHPGTCEDTTLSTPAQMHALQPNTQPTHVQLYTNTLHTHSHMYTHKQPVTHAGKHTRKCNTSSQTWVKVHYQEAQLYTADALCTISSHCHRYHLAVPTALIVCYLCPHHSVLYYSRRKSHN